MAHENLEMRAFIQHLRGHSYSSTDILVRGYAGRGLARGKPGALKCLSLVRGCHL